VITAAGERLYAWDAKGDPLPGSVSTIDIVPYDEVYGSGFEDMQRRVPDTQKLRQSIGWAPRHGLLDILDGS